MEHVCVFTSLEARIYEAFRILAESPIDGEMPRLNESLMDVAMLEAKTHPHAERALDGLIRKGVIVALCDSHLAGCAVPVPFMTGIMKKDEVRLYGLMETEYKIGGAAVSRQRTMTLSVADMENGLAVIYRIAETNGRVYGMYREMKKELGFNDWRVRGIIIALVNLGIIEQRDKEYFLVSRKIPQFESPIKVDLIGATLISGEVAPTTTTTTPVGPVSESIEDPLVAQLRERLQEDDLEGDRLEAIIEDAAKKLETIKRRRPKMDELLKELGDLS